VVTERTISWIPTWNPQFSGAGLEHLILNAYSADSVVLAIDEERGAFRLAYSLTWDERWRLRRAELRSAFADSRRTLVLQSDGEGHWTDGGGAAMNHLDGCVDIDIWPTPFTNSFPMKRVELAVGERKQFLMAWVFAPDLTVQAQPQAYTRIAEREYLFENLDGSGFKAELPVDADRIVLDYPELFKRVRL